MADVIQLPRDAVNGAVERMRTASEKAGVRPDDVDSAMIDAMAGVALALDAVVGRLEKKVDLDDQASSQAIEQVMRRVAGQSMERAARALIVRRRWRDVAVLAGAAAVVLVMGAWGGWMAGYTTAGQRTAWAARELQAAFHSGLPGAQWLASMAQLNDLATLGGECGKTVYSTDAGGQACTVHLWIIQPKASARGQ